MLDDPGTYTALRELFRDRPDSIGPAPHGIITSPSMCKFEELLHCLGSVCSAVGRSHWNVHDAAAYIHSRSVRSLVQERLISEHQVLRAERQAAIRAAADVQLQLRREWPAGAAPGGWGLDVRVQGRVRNAQVMQSIRALQEEHRRGSGAGTVVQPAAHSAAIALSEPEIEHWVMPQLQMLANGMASAPLVGEIWDATGLGSYDSEGTFRCYARGGYEGLRGQTHVLHWPGWIASTGQCR